MSKHIAVKFELTRAEGPTRECGKKQIATNWIDADKILKHWARNAPDSGGYYKCDFAVTYDDGEVYTGRYDLKRHALCRVAGSSHPPLRGILRRQAPPEPHQNSG